jgi:hypothetical protein
MKRLIIAAISVALMACGAIATYWNGYYLPNKPCRPTKYPDGEVISEDSSYLTKQSFAEIVDYYDRSLKPVAVQSANFRQWSKEQLDTNRILYICQAPDTNGLTTETGCIYVGVEPSGTRISLMLMRSEGSTSQCPRQ